jgi:hypothetical protein
LARLVEQRQAPNAARRPGARNTSDLASGLIYGYTANRCDYVAYDLAQVHNLLGLAVTGDDVRVSDPVAIAIPVAVIHRSSPIPYEGVGASLNVEDDADVLYSPVPFEVVADLG